MVKLIRFFLYKYTHIIHLYLRPRKDRSYRFRWANSTNPSLIICNMNLITYWSNPVRDSVGGYIYCFFINKVAKSSFVRLNGSILR